MKNIPIIVAEIAIAITVKSRNESAGWGLKPFRVAGEQRENAMIQPLDGEYVIFENHLIKEHRKVLTEVINVHPITGERTLIFSFNTSLQKMVADHASLDDFVNDVLKPFYKSLASGANVVPMQGKRQG